MSTEPAGTEPAGPIARLTVVALDTPDARGLAAFYGAITGWSVDHDHDEADWVQLRSDTGATIACQEAPDHVPPRWPDPAAPQQAHLDFEVADLAVADARVLALGARRADHQPGQHQTPRPFLVYLDPAGHPFCLVSER